MPERALVTQIVHRHQRSRAIEVRHIAVFNLVVCRHQPGLPIVRMQNIDVDIQNRTASSTARLKKMNRSQLSG